MRKSTKCILIASAVCFVIGVVFCIIGGVQSGSLIGGRYWVGFGHNQNWDFNKGFSLDDFELLDEFEGDEIQSLECEMDRLALLIKESEDDKGRIYIEEDEDQEFDYDLEGGTLFLNDETEGKHGWFFSIGVGDIMKKRVILELPKQRYEQIHLNIEAGAVKLSSIKAREVNIEIGAGYLENDGEIITDKMTLDVGAGYAQMNQVIIEQECLANVDAGNIEIEEISANRLEFDCDVGNIDCGLANAKTVIANCDVGNIGLRLAGCKEEYRIDQDCDLGNVDISHSHNRSHSETDSSRKLELNCDMGNIDISFEE